MSQYWKHHKKLKYYLLILAALWSAALVNGAKELLPFGQEAVDALVREESTVLDTKVYAGKLTIAQKETITEEVLTSYEAAEVSAIKTEDLFTVYAYSSHYGSPVTVNGQQINLNLVYYYNEISRETTLILATPIYNEDY